MKQGKELKQDREEKQKSKKVIKGTKKTNKKSNLKQKPEIKIVTSEKWDAGEAGLEISEKLAEMKNISFLMLFATSQYKDNGGFEKLLESVYSKISDEIIVVGGSVIGFTKYNLATIHGVLCLSFSYKNMDIAISCSKNTKRHPFKSGRKIGQNIESSLKNSKYKNKFAFTFTSGSQILKFPFMKPKLIIPFNLPYKFYSLFFSFISFFLQKGFGKEEDILEGFVNNAKNYELFGLSMGDSQILNNYQFYNKKVLKNSIVGLGISSDLNYEMGFSSGAKQSNIRFKITKMSKDKRIIHEINGKPALDELLRLMGWKKKMILDENKLLNSIFPKFPLGFYKNGKIILRPFVLILGKSLGFMSKIESDDAFIALMSGKDILNAKKELKLNKNNHFTFINSCGVRAMGLGRNINTEKEELQKIFKDNFVILYTAGEAYRAKNNPIMHLNESMVKLDFK